ncbi:chemotaxis protein [Methylorubrum extorquens]|uniref:chemotaxis protein n=1 Tax=Methylorubrum extorquens TaxID=408 RepID=UPI001EE61CD0|nr:chemotaxis protein [Methylorubrum extorquens]MCG5245058.1 chemotaxis protein [Methylorubrum extorquens]
MRQRERSARYGRRAPIAAIQQAAGDTSGAIGEIGLTIAQLSLIAAEVAAAAEQQGQASHEIARAIAGTAADARTVSLSIAEVRTAAASNEERSDEVRSGAKRVGNGSAALQVGAGTFLERVHAARGVRSVASPRMRDHGTSGGPIDRGNRRAQAGSPVSMIRAQSEAP